MATELRTEPFDDVGVAYIAMSYADLAHAGDPAVLYSAITK